MQRVISFQFLFHAVVPFLTMENGKSSSKATWDAAAHV
jgi:hypothetical protein